jgi:hypothetical protein
MVQVFSLRPHSASIYLEADDPDDAPNPDDLDAPDKDVKVKKLADPDLKRELGAEAAETKLITEWVEDALEPGSILTLPMSSSESQVHVTQFLSVQERIVLVPTYRDEEPQKKIWNVQTLAILYPESITMESSVIQSFLAGDPTKFSFYDYVFGSAPRPL